MSFVISKKQHLAPTEERAQYEPLILESEAFEIQRIDVNFGHPLYTTVADIFYIRTVEPQMQNFPVIPDGCISIVVKGKGEQIEAYICGAIDEIKKIEVYPDEYYIFIRFLPGVGYSLIKDDAVKITNRSIGVRDHLLGGPQILSILERETQLVERIRLVSKVIRVYMQGESDQYLIKYCTEKIFLEQGNIKVEKLAEETGFTSRYIGKMFDRCVGLSPKLYSQVIKLQSSMNRLMKDKDKLLVEIADDCGFFDHAHMNRTYKKLIRCSSGEFRKNSLRSLDYDEIKHYISQDVYTAMNDKLISSGRS